MLRTAAVSCLIIAVLANPAAGQDWTRGNHFYAGIVNGANFFDSEEENFDYDAGFVVGGQVGYTFDQWRSEAEISYATGSFDDAVDEQFDIEVIRGGVGLYYDATPITSLANASPYIGAGIGIANVTIEGTGNNTFEESDNKFTAHGEAGVTFNLSKHFALAPQYRFEWIDNGIDVLQEDLYAHVVRIAGRFAY